VGRVSREVTSGVSRQRYLRTNILLVKDDCRVTVFAKLTPNPTYQLLLLCLFPPLTAIIPAHFFGESKSGMSYQVLARKWRPRIFREMVGQEHVLQALINALDHNRLHHAYLFAGTRGVGKTTIARILAKCLNCETGVSSEPCGQ